MKKIIADYKLIGNEIKKIEGKFAKESDYDTVIDYNCEVYSKTGKPILFFIKNYIDKDILETAYKNMEPAAKLTNNRGAASGGVRNLGTLSDGKLSKMNYVYPEGTTDFSNKNRLQVRSGIAGYFDRNAHYDFCRTTAFNKKNIDKFKKAMPLINEVDKGFKEFVPERYKKQKEMIRATNPNYRIGDTAFTTITINKDYRTAYHYDAGDYPLGFGNLVAYCRDIEPMYLVLPRYGIGVNLDSNDLLLLDVHELHGNTEFIPKSENAVRLSFVMYYRENMWRCLSPKEELKRIQVNQRIVAQKYLRGE
tara:strand:+ start:1012 stop:1932 length:921 start_codon:yes stop_codon:yes gene_type:complete